MATILQALLNGTNATSVTTGNSGLSAVNGGWQYATAVHGEGTSSAKATTAGGTATLVAIHQVVSAMWYDFEVQLSTLDGGGVLIAQGALGAANRFQIYVQADGTIALRNGVTTVDFTAFTMPTGALARFAIGVPGDGTITCKVWTGTLTGSPTDTLTGTYSQGTFDRIKLGSGVAHSLDVYVDAITIDDAGFPGGSSNQLPVAHLTATPSPATQGQTVTLDASTSTDADGTVASYAFTQLTGPSTPLSGTGATRTLLAPAVTTGTPASYGVVVTDNSGGNSLQATAAITFNPAGPQSTADWAELCEGGNNGVTVTTSNTLFDSVDSGITFGAGIDGIGSHSIGGTTAAIQVGTHLIPAGLVSTEYLDLVYQCDALPAAGQFFYIAEIRSSTTVRGAIRIDSAGKLQCRNGTTAVGTATTATITAGQPFRVGWSILNGGTQSARLYTGANLMGASPDSGGTTSGTLNSGTFDRIRIGQAIAPSASMTWHADTIQVNASGPPSPLGGTGPGGSSWSALFEGGVAGVACTTGTAGLDSIATGLTFTSDAIGDGNLAVFCTTTAATAANAHLFTAASVYFMDWVHRVDALGDGTWIIAGYYSGSSTPITQLRTNVDGTVSIRNGTTLVATSKTIITPGLKVRYAWQLNGSTQTLRIFYGSNMWGSVPNETLTGAAPGTTADRFRFGAITSQTVTYTIDSMRGDPAAWPAPISNGTEHVPAGSNVYYAHGGVWVMAKMLVAHAGSWVDYDLVA